MKQIVNIYMKQVVLELVTSFTLMSAAACWGVPHTIYIA